MVIGGQIFILVKKFIIIITALLCLAQLLRAQSINIGATYEGGIIFYLDPSGAWGLAAAKNDLAPNYWRQADSICNNLGMEKKGNWRLPTIEELRLLYNQRAAVGGFTTGNQEYWSATQGVNQFNQPIAYTKNFSFGGLSGNERTPRKELEALSIRPIRTFYLPLTHVGVEAACIPPVDKYVPGQSFVTYGSGINIKNNTRRSSLTIGDMCIGQATREKVGSMGFGFLSDFFVAPSAPVVMATQGDLLDRIQISWMPNPLGALPTEGYKLFRDGVFLGAFDNKVRNFNDFNVIAGRPYKYEVLGINTYGDGALGAALGFQVPNGVVTGFVQTSSKRPVVDATVTLMPMQGFSLRSGFSDVAFALDSIGFLKNATNWSVSVWVQNINRTVTSSTILQFEGAAWSIATLDSTAISSPFGLKLNVNGQSPLLLPFPDSTKNGWHHIMVNHDGAQYRAYLDGVLMGNIMTAAANGSAQKLTIAGEGCRWEGRMDELRIYHRRLDELDLTEVREGTASTLTPGLKYYWKMDEELGTKSFDVIQRNRLYFCGAEFDKSRPPVRTSGKTNSDGYYRIESANYGTGTTFIATPGKNFYLHRALKFVRTEQDYASLPNFGLTDSTELQTATIELWANSAGPDGSQCLISKEWGSNSFQLNLSPSGNSSNLGCTVNGQPHTFGNLGMGYQHIALTLQQTGSNLSIKAYKNGTALGTVGNFSGLSGNWSDTSKVWLVGARHNGASRADYYGGLIDEIAVYDTLLSTTKIQTHATKSRDQQERHLRAYFAMDEGAGSQLNNSGSHLTTAGKSFGTEWSAFAPNQKTTPHEFSPKTRQVTLNPSITSVDLVDFVDLSTVPVKGFVRYVNSDCFAKSVEILINGESANPQIFTDSTGAFAVDLEPGATVRLSPKFEDHNFIPAFWEVNNISSPIIGVLFNDMTTRKVDGVVAGGKCKRAIIPAPGDCVIKLASKDGCYSKILTLNDPDGDFEFEDLPPIEMTLSVVNHKNPTIKKYFQNIGGASLDLTKRDTSFDFIYYATPEVEITSGFDGISNCQKVVFAQGDQVNMTIKLVEKYYGAPCEVDSASFQIINGIAGSNLDTTMSKGQLRYKFKVGVPNPVAPFEQTLQIIAKTLEGDEVSFDTTAIVTGVRPNESTFTTAMPATPSLVLRDPPGDGSYSYWEKGQKTCQTLAMSLDYETGLGREDELKIGFEQAAVITAFGVGISIPAKTELGTKIGATLSYQKVTDTSFQTCVAFDQRISTGEDDFIVGGWDPGRDSTVGFQGADVFVGTGINLKFGFADRISYNPDSCKASIKTITQVAPGGINTTFIYTEDYIRRYVVRYLDSLANGTAIADSIAYYKNSKKQWLKILDDNEKQKAAAKKERNISFNGGPTYEYSITSDTTGSNTTTNFVNSNGSLEGSVGFEIGGAGYTTNVKFEFSTSAGWTDESGVEKGITTGYVLHDDDPGDAFTVDVAMDPVYKTPVFRTITGQSSCPWEPKTAHREGCKMTLEPGYTTEVLDVPAHEPAVYRFILGNTSATKELRTYAFTAGPESNPHGAVIKLNGAPLDHPVLYAIPPGEPVPITITLERGPEEYNYDSLEVVLYSECEDTRAGQLGLVPDEDTILYSAIYISAHFIKPCSEVDISGPEQNWVMSPGNPLLTGPNMDIILSGYDKNDPDLKDIAVQYRPSNGDGAWIAIGNPIPKATLSPIYTTRTWSTAGLPDGDYEIRAIANCTGNSQDNPGYSQVIKGRIERKGPLVIGAPEPSDGVLHSGDEISVTFNKNINCSKLIKAVMGDPGNVGLYNSATGELIDFELDCSANKIELFLDPQVVINKFIENQVLRLQLNDIPDLVGNKLVNFIYEFYVDRNELAWLTDSIGMTKTEGEIKTVTAGIHNRGGSPMSFKITGAPSWVRVVPDRGTLVPNEIKSIQFEVDSTLAFGTWRDTLTLQNTGGLNPFFMGGNEQIPLGVRVVCAPPDWHLDAGIHPVTMNMVAELNIQGQKSSDEEDIVAAFIKGELRGRARIQYYPSVNKYLAHLTIYGESNETLDSINFQIWDASACLRYGTVMEKFLFKPEKVIGTPIAPQVLHTNSLVLREIPLNNGWNWLSFNLLFPDPAINSALASLKYPDNDLIKDQVSFSPYENPLAMWIGSLDSMGNKTMYQYRADRPDTLKMMGLVIDPATTPIALDSNWNWIGYVPNYPLSVNDALSSIDAEDGNLIKGQYGFSQYIDGFGWIGNLRFLYPPQGYQIKLSKPGTLTYPPKSNLGPEETKDRGRPELAFWNVDASKFEHSMTLIGMIAQGEQNITGAQHEIGVFAGNELRGSAKAIYVAPYQAYVFFLTTYANSSGEALRFKLYDGNTGKIQELRETLYFAADLHQGSIAQPVPFGLLVSGSNEPYSRQSLEVQPNPFQTGTLIRFGMAQDEEVWLTMTDIRGRLIERQRMAARQGLNTLSWMPDIAPGVYLIQLQTTSGIAVQRIIKE